MSDPTQPGDPPRRFLVALKRLAVLIPLVAVCALLPGLLPGRGASGAPSSDPSAILRRVDSLRPTPTPGAGPAAAPGKPVQDPTPTDREVAELAKTVANEAGAGYDLPVTAKELAAVQTKPGPYQRLGEISIPSIGLKTTYGEGVNAKTLNKGPGHWPGTPMPGRAGNAVISGHRNTHTRPFKELDELDKGDQVIVDSPGQGRVTYQVRKTTIVPQAKYKDFVLRQPDDARAREITLFACHPEGNPVFRIVVQATKS